MMERVVGMKCTVEIDCTPLEARQFFGLPDVTPLQARILAEVEKKMLAEMDRFSPEAMLKTWLSVYSQTPEPLQDLFSKMMTSAGGMGRSSPRSGA